MHPPHSTRQASKYYKKIGKFSTKKKKGTSKRKRSDDDDGDDERGNGDGHDDGDNVDGDGDGDGDGGGDDKKKKEISIVTRDGRTIVAGRKRQKIKRGRGFGEDDTDINGTDTVKFAASGFEELKTKTLSEIATDAGTGAQFGNPYKSYDAVKDDTAAAAAAVAAAAAGGGDSNMEGDAAATNGEATTTTAVEEVMGE
jgi:hypothetical protein